MLANATGLSDQEQETTPYYPTQSRPQASDSQNTNPSHHGISESHEGIVQKIIPGQMGVEYHTFTTFTYFVASF